MLKEILRKHRKKIIGAMLLVTFEAVLYISEPYIFGFTIDDVTGKRVEEKSFHFIFIALIPWIAVYTSNFLVGTWRRIYDRKAYSIIFADTAEHVAAKQFNRNIETTRIVARSNMARQLVDFMEESLPQFIEQLITVVGSMTALSLLDWRSTIACIIMIVPYLFINRYFTRRIAKEQIMLNNTQENEVLTFLDRNPKKILQFYQLLGKRQVYISKLSAYNYGIFKILTMVIFISILYIALDLDEFSVGEIYSVVAYIWVFIGASEYIPYLSEKWTSMRDVARRLSIGNEEGEYIEHILPAE